jgi:hypothetical protein
MLTRHRAPCLRNVDPGGGELTRRLWGRLPAAVRHGIVAGAAAGAVSGAPSTAYAMAVGGDPLEASAAAGSLLLPTETRIARLLAAAVPVHCGLSLGWGVVLSMVLPRRNTTAWGVVAGAAIAALDFGVARPHFARISSLALAPQIADHLMYGAVAGAMLARRRRSG